jgi:glycine cleavage system transcriptional repressor
MDTGFAVVTAVGADRVGIVRDLSAAIELARCNIEESRMAVLGGEFAVIMLVSGAPDDLRALCADTARLGTATGLHLDAHLTEPPSRGEEGRPYTLESVSLDAPGIVHAVTEILRKHAINIVQMDTETTAAPWTGACMFRLRARLVIPAGVPVPELRHELEDLELERDLDTVLKPEA